MYMHDLYVMMMALHLKQVLISTADYKWVALKLCLYYIYTDMYKDKLFLNPHKILATEILYPLIHKPVKLKNYIHTQILLRSAHICIVEAKYISVACQSR